MLDLGPRKGAGRLRRVGSAVLVGTGFWTASAGVRSFGAWEWGGFCSSCRDRGGGGGLGGARGRPEPGARRGCFYWRWRAAREDMIRRPAVGQGEAEGALLRDEELVALTGCRHLSLLLRRRAPAGTASQARRAVGATPMPLRARGLGTVRASVRGAWGRGPRYDTAQRGRAAHDVVARLAECFPVPLLEYV
jgi:hypothetical protein